MEEKCSKCGGETCKNCGGCCNCNTCTCEKGKCSCS